MSDYLEIPVSAARGIAENFGKSIVLIIAWDPKHLLMHLTTYGVSAADKVNAALGGETCARALGCDLGAKRDYSDFRRDFDAGLLREAEEIFVKIRSRQGCTGPQLLQIERWLNVRGLGIRAGAD